MVEYNIANRSICDILSRICKDIDLYPYLKQHKSKRDIKWASYAIPSRWLCPNKVNVTASKAKLALQMLMYDGEKWHETGKNILPNMSRNILS